MGYTVSGALTAKAYTNAAATQSWWDRWRDKGPATRVRPRTNLVDYGAENVLTTFDGYKFFWDAQRINAPGFADQNWFEMSRSYYSQAYLGISTLNRHCYQAEADFYEKDPSDTKRKIPIDASDDVIHFFDHPNPKESFADILEQTSLQRMLTGMAPLWTPWELEYDWDRPNEMYVLSTASLIPQPMSPLWPNGAWLVQPWLPAGPYAQVPVQMGVGTVVPAEQIQLVKEPHPFFRWTGYSVLFALATQTDCVKMIDFSRANGMKQGINPPFMLSFDNLAWQPDEAQLRRLQAQLQQIYAGPKAAGVPFIAPPFAKLEMLSHQPIEMGWEQSWMQLLEFTLACMGLNKSICNMGDGTYAKAHAELMGFYANTLNPYLDKIASVMTRQIIWPWYGKDIHLHLHGKTMADEQQDRAKVDSICRYGLGTIGEVRQLLGLPASDKDKEWIKAPGQQQQGGPMVPGQAGGVPGSPTDNAGGGNVFAEALGELDKQRSEPDNPLTGKTAMQMAARTEEIMEQLKRRGRAIERKPRGGVMVSTNGHIPTVRGTGK